MAKEYNDIAGIEAYLDGTLEGEAKERFEDWRKNDPESGRKIAAQRLLRLGMEALAIKEYRKTVAEWQQEPLEEGGEEDENEDVQQEQTRKLNPWLMYAIAASVLLLVLFIGNRYLNQSTTPSALAKAEYELPDFERLQALRSVSSTQTPQEKRSFAELCADTVNQSLLTPDSADYAWKHYVWGHCYTQQEEKSKAVAAFRIAYEASGDQPDINSGAYWNLILALLQDEQSFSEEEVSLLLNSPPRSASPGLKRKVEKLKEDLF